MTYGAAPDGDILNAGMLHARLVTCVCLRLLDWQM